MRLVLTGRHVSITPALRRLVDRKLLKIQRLLNDSVVSTQVVLTREKHRHVTDMSVHVRGDHILAGKTDGQSWNTSVAAAVDKIEQQAQKVKEKWTKRKRRATSARRLPAPGPGPLATAEEIRTPRIVRAPGYHVKPMSVETAAAAVETTGEPFLVFRNAGTGAINVLYRRKSGDLGLIEPDR